jgi:hypothetical protein
MGSHLPGWWGVADIPSTAEQACPARQVWRLTRVMLPQCGKRLTTRGHVWALCSTGKRACQRQKSLPNNAILKVGTVLA